MRRKNNNIKKKLNYNYNCLPWIVSSFQGIKNNQIRRKNLYLSPSNKNFGQQITIFFLSLLKSNQFFILEIQTPEHQN